MTFRLLPLLSLLLAPTLSAQIYADFTIVRGEENLGTFRAELDHEKAPRTCANFIGLASGKRPWVDVKTGAVRTNTPFYNGLTFHRLIHNFMIQGGSPNGQGTDGPGYAILDEYHPDLKHSTEYILSMAKSGVPNSGGSQFFITLTQTSHLDNKHSVFGKITTGTELINSFKNISSFPTGNANKPLTDIIIDSVLIHGPDYADFEIDSPSLRLPHVSSTMVRITRDSGAETMTATFNRRPKTNYLFLQSPDLKNWLNPWNILSLNGETAHTYTLESRPEPSYFLNLATTNYVDIPTAPSDLNSNGKTLRIKFSEESFLDIKPDGVGGGTWIDDNGNGTLTQTTWIKRAPETGITVGTFSQVSDLSLGKFETTLQDYPNPGNNVLFVTWLSFHTETAGWTEETHQNAPANRFPFEILSN